MTTRRSRLWLIAAGVFTVINLLGAPYAALQGEWPHAAIHVVLTVLGVYFIRRLAPGARGQELAGAQETDDRLEHLQQSVDAIALEVERIGEAQRFIAKRAKEQVEVAPPKPEP